MEGEDCYPWSAFGSWLALGIDCWEQWGVALLPPTVGMVGFFCRQGEEVSCFWQCWAFLRQSELAALCCAWEEEGEVAYCCWAWTCWLLCSWLVTGLAMGH